MDQAWIALGVGTIIPLVILRGIDTQTPSLESLKWIMAGAILIAPAFIVEVQLVSLVSDFGLSAAVLAAVKAFAIYALIEEAVRYCAIDYAFRHFTPRFRDLLFISLWISMGFAIVENTFYIYRAPPDHIMATALVRILLPTIAHLCCGIIIVGGLTRAFGRLSMLAVPAAILFHGSYDWIAGAKTGNLRPLFGMIALGLIVVGVVVRRGRVMESSDINR
jgi:RsiW-degrading membrane proteinase PrsW (M82 family)